MDKSENSDAAADDSSKKAVSVKTEPEDDSIKNYAEHTMNELLGLFGYEDKVNSTDTENLHLENYTDNQDDDPSAKDAEEKKSKSVDKLKPRLPNRLSPLDDSHASRHHMNIVTVLKEREKEDESGSQRDIDSSLECNWCHKPGNKQVSLETPTGTKVFCSEVCFTQCRRASFKKSKTCDWCKHVRHTVNYVEFQDGETQLQFCSEKCLNQYKMSIFCKETQEHLQKMNKKSSSCSDGKDDEQILITPELWMRGEHARRAAEARESARERERQERTENRDNYKKAFTVNSDKVSGHRSHHRMENAERAKNSLLDRIKHEANIKHRRTLIADRETERSSPPRPEPQSSAPSPQQDQTVPSHFFHPSVAAMAAPWIHQAQLMGAFPQGLLPYGPLPPFMLAGYVPPTYATLSKDTREKDDHEREKTRVKMESANKYGQAVLLSPGSESSAVSGPSPRSSESRVSPAVLDRRTSSLFPVDFPQYLSGQNTAASLMEAAAQRPAIPGVPPVTMMFPFPVPLPLPVPIPIPIPLTMKQLTTFFGERDKVQNKNENPPKFSPASKLKVEIPKEARSPVFMYPHSPQSVASVGSEFNNYEKNEGRSGSRNSCPDLSSNICVTEYSRIKRSESQCYKRERSPEVLRSLDLSRTSKIARYDYHSTTEDSNDGVIDLSSTRHNGSKYDDNCTGSDVMNGSTNEDSCLSRDDNDNYTEDGPPVPKIHIITHEEDAPLNQPLPLPPTDNSYSSRRGLILDAPTIPKKSRSPSPERRVYVRNVPRDIIEAARRRCMRARIRTK